MSKVNNNTKKKELVLVTGANGYIGSDIVRLLLKEGYNVRGTVRGDINDIKYQFLYQFENAHENLHLMTLNLLDKQEQFDEIVQNVNWIMHVAAPVAPAFRCRTKKDEELYIKQAIHGTISLLQAAATKSKTVTKFILTSSYYTIIQGHDYTERIQNHIPFTENDWTNLNGKNINVYDKCKTLSEKAAWEFVEKHNKDSNISFTLTTIHPTTVLGPLHSNIIQSPSLLFISEPLKGFPGIPNIYLPIVDIRHVSQAHINAALIPNAANKRFIINGYHIFYPDVAKILQKEYSNLGYYVFTFKLPYWILYIASYFKKDVALILHLIDQKIIIDNSLSKNILKIQYDNIPLKDTIIDCAYSLIKYGIVYKSRKYLQQQQSVNTKEKKDK